MRNNQPVSQTVSQTGNHYLDMPSEAFADLWQTLQGGESWSAPVKNRRKISVIDGIAFQTNILALNAAVEAPPRQRPWPRPVRTRAGARSEHLRGRCHAASARRTPAVQMGLARPSIPLKFGARKP